MSKHYGESSFRHELCCLLALSRIELQLKDTAMCTWRADLMSLQESGNPIIYTNGDNDTFPLVQPGDRRVSVPARTCNLSYLQTDWYIDQMKRPPTTVLLSPSWDRMEYVEGTNEYVPIQPEYKKSIDQALCRSREAGTGR